MPFMTWVKTPKGYEPVEITDEEVFAENAKRKAEREKMERISEQLQDFDRMQKSCLTCSHKDKTCRPMGYSDKTSCMDYEPKERDMKFDKSRVYTSLNADELKAGDKVIVAYNLYQLKERVQMFTESVINEIETICAECYCNRFKVKHDENYPLPLAYLVERKENCTNCGNSKCDVTFASCFHRCDNYNPKTTEKKAPAWFVKGLMDGSIERTNDEPIKKVRPFKDTDELIKVWQDKTLNKTGLEHYDWGLTMPLIWVQRKDKSTRISQHLITSLNTPILKKEQWFNGITVESISRTFDELFNLYEFLDGSPCGVEE